MYMLLSIIQSITHAKLYKGTINYYVSGFRGMKGMHFLCFERLLTVVNRGSMSVVNLVSMGDYVWVYIVNEEFNMGNL